MRRSAVLLLTALVLTTPVVVRADEGRSALVKRFASELDQHYIYPDRGHAAAERIRARLKAHAYDGLDNLAFARAVTADANAVAHDKHIHFYYNVYPLPTDDDPNAPLSDAQRQAARRRAESPNFSFAPVRILRGDVGYIDLRGFPAAEYIGPALAKAMQSIAGAHAIIIDESLNNGGHPETVALLASYFFPQGSRVHLDDIALRGERKKMLSFYTSEVSGPRFPKAPLYILTSGATFSSGEAFAYDMQALKRATVIGQTTQGGANGGFEHHYTRHFSAFIPFARGINPITHTNWEGVGVKPDIAAPMKESFKVAYLAALRSNLDTVSPEERGTLAQWIASVEQTDPEALARQFHAWHSVTPLRTWVTHAK